MIVGQGIRACSQYQLLNTTTINKFQLMIRFFTNHDPYFSNNDLEIVEGYCGEWKSPCVDFEPIDRLGRRNKLGQA